MTLKKLGSHRNTQKVIMYAQVINFSKTSDWRGAEQETGTSRFFWRKDHNNISILVHRTTRRQLQGLGLCNHLLFSRMTLYYMYIVVGSLSSVKVPWQKVNSKELKGEQAEEWDFISAGHYSLAAASFFVTFLLSFCYLFNACTNAKKVGWIWIRSLHDMLC